MEPTRVYVWQDSDVTARGDAPRQGTGYARTVNFVDREHDSAFAIATITKAPDVGRDFFSPRHHHTFDQLRYFFSSGFHYGKKTYVAGDCLYIPGGAYYGPMTPADNDAACHVFFQFRGNSGIPYYPAVEMQPAKERLKARGHFEKGIYIGEDGKKQDGWEAMLEEHVHHKIEYPKTTLLDYVVVRTSNLGWHDVPNTPSAQIKYVGHFTEVGPNVALYQLATGTRLPGGTRPFHQFWALGEGSVRFGDEPDRALTPAAVRFAPAGSAYEEIECVEDAQVLLVQWAVDGEIFPPSV